MYDIHHPPPTTHHHPLIQSDVSLSLCLQSNGERVAVKVFAGSAEFKSLKREIDVVRSLPAHENIVMLFGDEEEVSMWSMYHSTSLPGSCM